MSQGREPEGFGLSFPPRPAGSGGGQACTARQLGRGAAVSAAQAAQASVARAPCLASRSRAVSLRGGG